MCDITQHEGPVLTACKHFTSSIKIEGNERCVTARPKGLVTKVSVAVVGLSYQIFQFSTSLKRDLVNFRRTVTLGLRENRRSTEVGFLHKRSRPGRILETAVVRDSIIHLQDGELDVRKFCRNVVSSKVKENSRLVVVRSSDKLLLETVPFWTQSDASIKT